MPTLTTNLSLNKPLVANPVDADLWGGYLNTNMDTLDGAIYSEASLATTSPVAVAKSAFNTFHKADCTTTSIVYNIGASTTLGSGWYAHFKKIDSSTNTVTLTPNGAETIDGATFLTLDKQYQGVTLYSDGSNLFVGGKGGLQSIGKSTAGNIISFNASGDAAYVATGTDKQTLASNGAGAIPAFEYLYVKRTLTSSSEVTNVTASIPYDNSAPQIGEGTEILMASHTPLATANRLLVKAVVYGAVTSTSANAVLALFNGATDALTASTIPQSVNNGAASTTVMFEQEAGTTSAVTFSIRAGTSTGNFYVNGNSSGTRLFGAIPKSYLEIIEVGS